MLSDIKLRIYIYISSAIILFVMVMLLFHIEDFYHISFLLIIGSLVYCGISSVKKLSLIDIFLVLVLFFEIISFFFSECPIASSYMIYYYVFLLSVYFLLRRLLDNSLSLKIISKGSSIICILSLFITLCSFFVFRTSVLDVGFFDTYNFRFLFRPLGYITNTWAEVSLVILGWLCLIKSSNIAIFLNILVILLSFSRGAYIALFVYMLCMVLFLKVSKRKKQIFISFIFAVICIASVLPRELMTTLKMNYTESQQISTDRRIDVVQSACESFQKKIWLGYGNNNFSYAIDPLLNQDNTKAYTATSPNIILQLLVEKGIVGTLLYIGLLFSIYFIIWKKRRQESVVIIGCIFTSLFVKEMSQATLLTSPILLFMFVLLLAFLQKNEIQQSFSDRRNLNFSFMIALFLCTFCFWNMPSLIDKLDSTGNNINNSLAYISKYEKEKKKSDLKRACAMLEKAIEKHPDDVQIQYLKAYCYFISGDFSNSIIILNKLVKMYPNNALYAVTFSDLKYKQNEKDESLKYFLNAVWCVPRLLTNERIYYWKKNDGEYYKSLFDSLSKISCVSDTNASDLARYGYIAKWCGKSDANIYLELAVKKMPNLSTPWLLLGEDMKYRLLIFGAYKKNLSNLVLPKMDSFTDNDLFRLVYKNKFHRWYGCELGNLE